MGMYKPVDYPPQLDGVKPVSSLLERSLVGSTVWLFRASQRKSELLGH